MYMKTSHAGLGITRAEWDANLRYAEQALERHGIAGRERAEFLELFTRYESEIVERDA